jgi:phosphoglycolate phosphatase-like HAD superfamily hydrolase
MSPRQPSPAADRHCTALVGVAFGAHSRAELEPFGPDAVIDRLSHLVPLVEGR